MLCIKSNGFQMPNVHVYLEMYIFTAVLMGIVFKSLYEQQEC